MASGKPDSKKLSLILLVIVIMVGAVLAKNYMDSVNNRPEISQTEVNRVGDFFTGEYHRPGCPKVESITEGNRHEFNNNDEAKSAGYRACKVCTPDK